MTRQTLQRDILWSAEEDSPKTAAWSTGEDRRIKKSSPRDVVGAAIMVGSLMAELTDKAAIDGAANGCWSHGISRSVVLFMDL